MRSLIVALMIVLAGFWAPARHNNPAMQEGLNRGYYQVAQELHATVAPVAVAWQRALTNDPRLTLHQADKSHPTVEGTYLAACILYATLFGTSPVGLPAELHGENHAWKIAPPTPRRLQTTAWEAVQSR